MQWNLLRSGHATILVVYGSHKMDDSGSWHVYVQVGSYSILSDQIELFWLDLHDLFIAFPVQRVTFEIIGFQAEQEFGPPVTLGVRIKDDVLAANEEIHRVAGDWTFKILILAGSSFTG